MLGVGELLVTSIDREGTWMGFDLDLVRSIADAVKIPVIAHGGAGKLEYIEAVTASSNASAVGFGSIVVFQKRIWGPCQFSERGQYKVSMKKPNFSFSELESQLQKAVNMGYQILTCAEYAERKGNIDQPTIVNRIDIDVSVKKLTVSVKYFLKMEYAVLFLYDYTRMSITHFHLKIIAL